MGAHERRIQDSLPRRVGGRALVHPLRQGFGDEGPAAVTILGEFGRARGNLVQGAARTCNGALQMVDQHPWGTQFHALAVAFLPAFVGKLLGEDGLAHRYNLVGQLPMQALAVGHKLALPGRLAPPSCLVAVALLPAGSAFLALLRTAPLVIVLRFAPPPLPLHPALPPAT